MAHNINIRIKLETGFEFSTDETNLKVKLRCKPPRTPPNTHLKMVSFIQRNTNIRYRAQFKILTMLFIRT